MAIVYTLQHNRSIRVCILHFKSFLTFEESFAHQDGSPFKGECWANDCI